MVSKRFTVSKPLVGGGFETALFQRLQSLSLIFKLGRWSRQMEWEAVRAPTHRTQITELLPCVNSIFSACFLHCPCAKIDILVDFLRVLHQLLSWACITL